MAADATGTRACARARTRDRLAEGVAYDRRVDEHGRQLVYSVTKTFLGVLCLRLELDLDAPVTTGSTTDGSQRRHCGSC